MPSVHCLMGPTCSGKTSFALKLCELRPYRIISVDSALVYRGMDIGTAKPDPLLLSRFPHALVDIRDPSEPYSAADFCEDATRTIQDAFGHQQIPLLVGGTMMYFAALQRGLSPLPSADPQVRERLKSRLKNEGILSLYQTLITLDPKASRLHPHDTQRILRALEVYETTGRSLWDFWKMPPIKSDFHFVNVGLMPERTTLSHAIAARFDEMLGLGLLEEVQALYARPDLHADLPSIRTVGYRQIWQYLSGKIDKERMRETAIIATRQLAKRQFTWLRSWPNITHLENMETLSPRELEKVLMRR